MIVAALRRGTEPGLQAGPRTFFFQLCSCAEWVCHDPAGEDSARPSDYSVFADFAG
jgi:hypothetical protein